MSEKQDFLAQTLAYNHIPFPIIIFDQEGLITWFNGHAENIFQLNTETAKGQAFTYMNPEQAALHKQPWETLLESNDPIRFENMEIGLGSGGQTHSTIVTKAFTSHDERFLMTVYETDDSTNAESATRELSHLRNGLDDSFMMLYFDKEFLVTYANPHFLKLSKWTPKRVLGKPVWQMFHDSEADVEFVDSILETLKEGQIWNGEARKATKDGETYWVDLTAIPMQLSEEDTYYIFLEKDITDTKHAQKHLEEIAFIDPITGLENRHRLEQAVNEHIREGRHFSFLFLDIDRFYTLRDVSDTDTENGLLIEFTKRLRMYFSDSLITRAGLHEFALVTPLPNWFIEGFLPYLQQHPIYIGGTAVPLTVSGAITKYPEDQQSFVHLIKASYATIKKVKDRGGSAISTLTADDHERLNRKALIEKRLVHALDRKNLQLLYQPQINLSNGNVESVEALVRWNDDEIGVVTPDELIPIAEENGMIHEIGNFVLETACEQLKDWKAKGIDLRISINSSIREFRDKDMASNLIEQMKANNCDPHSLMIEITEKFALEAEAERPIMQQMNRLHQQGVQFALDDFGTGYASFRYMLLLPISSLKIDRTIIQSITKQEKMQKMIKGMIQFGQSLDFQVTAEGVETKEQLELLRAMECDSIQGYIISRPMSSQELEKWLK